MLVTFDRAHWNVHLKNLCILLYVNYIPFEKNWGHSLWYSVLISGDLSDLEFSIFIIIGRNVTFLNLKAALIIAFYSPGHGDTQQFPPLNFHILSVFLQFSPNPGLKYSYNLWRFLLCYHEFHLIHGISSILCFFFHLGLPLYFHAYLSNSLC